MFGPKRREVDDEVPRIRGVLLMATVAALLAGRAAVSAQEANKKTDWREDDAY